MKEVVLHQARTMRSDGVFNQWNDIDQKTYRDYCTNRFNDDGRNIIEVRRFIDYDEAVSTINQLIGQLIRTALNEKTQKDYGDPWIVAKEAEAFLRKIDGRVEVTTTFASEHGLPGVVHVYRQKV